MQLCCFHLVCYFHESNNEVWIYKPKNHGIKCKKVHVLFISPGGGAGQVGDGDGFFQKVSPALEKIEVLVTSCHLEMCFYFALMPLFLM